MKYYIKTVACLLLAGAAALWAQKEPVDWVNTLVGTAPLDKQELIGNAPPPGEELYTGMTSAAAVLPHGITDLGPINKNLDALVSRRRGHVVQLPAPHHVRVHQRHARHGGDAGGGPLDGAAGAHGVGLRQVERKGHSRLLRRVPRRLQGGSGNDRHLPDGDLPLHVPE